MFRRLAGRAFQRIFNPVEYTVNKAAGLYAAVIPGNFHGFVDELKAAMRITAKKDFRQRLAVLLCWSLIAAARSALAGGRSIGLRHLLSPLQLRRCAAINIGHASDLIGKIFF